MRILVTKIAILQPTCKGQGTCYLPRHDALREEGKLSHLPGDVIKENQQVTRNRTMILRAGNLSHPLNNLSSSS
jgi:hypothetical protein